MMAQMGGEKIIKDFAPSDTEHPLAVRLTGKFKTAFPDGKPKAAEPPADRRTEAGGEEARRSPPSRA